MDSQLCRRFIHLWTARSACACNRILRSHSPAAIHLSGHARQRSTSTSFLLVNGSRSAQPQLQLKYQRKESTLSLGLTNPTSPSPSTSVTSKSTATNSATPWTSLKAKRSVSWDAESERTLIDLQAKGYSWEQIGQTIHKGPRSCQLHFETSLDPALKDFWTPTKVAQLQDLVAKGTPWSEVAKILETLPATCIEKHRQLVALARSDEGNGWSSSSVGEATGTTSTKTEEQSSHLPTTVHGASNNDNNSGGKKKKKTRITSEWDAESDRILLEMRQAGAKWTEIAERIGREAATCLHRYESTLNPALADFWTDDKIQQLDQLVGSGKSWADIARILGIHRLAVKEKWRLMGQVELEVQQQTAAQWAIEAKKKLKQRKQESRNQNTEDESSAFRDLRRSLQAMHEVDQQKDHRSWNELLRDDARYEHYRSWKKQHNSIFSDSSSRLYLMNAGWAAKEEAILIQHVLKHGLNRWDEVSAVALKGRFSPEECRSCWKNLDMPVAMPDGDLEEKMQDSGLVGMDEGTEAGTAAANDAKSFKIVKPGTALEGATIQASRSREWTSDQQVHFWYLWREYGRNWTTISRGLGDKSPDACKAYFQKITSIVCSGSGGSDAANGVDKSGNGAQKTKKRITHNSGHDDRDDDDLKLDEPEVLKLAKAITHNFTRKWKNPVSQLSGAEAPNKVVIDKKSRQQFVWTKARSVRLQSFMRQAYRGRIGSSSNATSLDDINWNWLARRVHPELTGRICRNHWKHLHNMDSTWTQDDIRKLEEGVRLLGPRKLAAIRQHFLPHMTKEDVTRQWFRISDKATTITEDEYYTLLAAVDKYGAGNRWDKVESEMPPGWKRPPCKRVWESSFKHLMTKAKWTESADKMLLRMVEMVGRDDWYAVAKAMQTGHSPWELRLRWCQLIDPIKLETPDITIQGLPVSSAT